MAAISAGDPRDAELLLGPRSNGSDAHGTASFRFRPVNCATDRQHMSDSLISLCEAYSWPRVIKLLREGGRGG